MSGGVRPVAFRTPAAFRAWLRQHHGEDAELLVRCYKAGQGHRGVTYRQALDQALCFGWIDGVRRAVDAVSFSVRFSPRKARSAWSRVNLRRARELEAEGRMQPSGRRALETRTVPSYSYESRPQALARAFLRRFRSRPRAWAFFQAQPPWYRRTSSFWVMSARRPETRERRFAILLASSETGAPVPPLERKLA